MQNGATAGGVMGFNGVAASRGWSGHRDAPAHPAPRLRPAIAGEGRN